MIDSGNHSNGESILKHINKYYPNQDIDIAIVTHSDKDHFGGYIYLLEQIKNKNNRAVFIDRFIVNDPGNHISAEDVKRRRSDERVKKEARSVYDLSGHGNLLDIIDELGIEREEWLVSMNSENIKDKYFYVLGPSNTFYEHLVPLLRHDLEPVSESSLTIFSASTGYRDIDSEKDDDSTHNASSLIFLFLPNGLYGEKYLFCGDASREAFEKVLYKEEMRNCDWLKVPHHGSIHNLDTALIKFINPKIAYISASGDDKHPAVEIIDALRANQTKVYSTNHHGTLLSRRGTARRAGWIPVKPL